MNVLVEANTVEKPGTENGRPRNVTEKLLLSPTDQDGVPVTFAQTEINSPAKQRGINS